MKKILLGIAIMTASFATNATLYIGDSIAHGYKEYNNGKGITKVGANPSTVLSYLEKADLDNIKNLVLSTGISNNCKQRSQVEKQFQHIRYKNINLQILLLNSPYCKNYIFLKQLCTNDHNCRLVTFPTTDGIHPTNYKRDL